MIRSIAIFNVVLALSALSWTTPSEAAPFDIGGLHQLFLDDGIIESSNGLQRQVGTAAKHSSTPVLARTQPWEAARAELYGSAVWNPTQQRYELFYSAMSQPYDTRLAVAYSNDTINWTRPALSQYSFNGISPTNIVYVMPADDPGIQGPYASTGAWVHGPSVIYDAQDTDPSRRYKMITNAGNGYMNALFSPDGVNWTTYNANPVINITSDTGNSVLWDPVREKYILYGRLRDSSGVREIFRSESSNFTDWSTPQTVYTPTAADRSQSLEFYGHSVTYYEGLYVGLTWMFPNTPASVDSSSDSPVTWPILTVSHDGINWQRVSDQPFLPLGPAGTFDHRQIRTASSFVVTDDEVVLMYSGSPNAHVSGHNFDIGQAELPRDRFASLESGSAPASLLTKTMEYRSGRLFVNADIASDGYVRVGLVDANGNPVPGFGGEISHAASGDSLRERVWWDGHAFLPKSAPAGTRFQFSMKNAKLYSFWVEPVAPTVEIDLVNSTFDRDSLPNNNQYNFTASYAGWTEVNPATGVANQLFNVGPIHLPPSDLSQQYDSATNVLYYQESPTNVRVDQTTLHAIAAGDHQFELSVKVGNDSLPGRFGGYNISLYADNGSTKTILKTLSGADIADDELAECTLTLTDDVDLDFAPFIGQQLGVALSSLGLTYLNPQGNPVPGIVFYDSVRLFAIGVTQLDPGDYDGNGIVDVADYVVWRHSVGQAGAGLAADGNHDNMVNTLDYDMWRSHFGQTAGNGTSQNLSEAQSAAVPEPASLVLLLAGGMVWAGSRTSRRDCRNNYMEKTKRG